jgi:membrane protein
MYKDIIIQTFEKITIQASSLSFYTIFSIVPIILIILSLLSSTPMFSEYYQKIESFIVSNILPTNQDTIKTYITSFVQNSKSMGTTGGIYIFITSILFFKNFETIMKGIFHSQKRDFFNKVTVYWTTMTLFPILFSFSIYLSIKIQNILNASVYTQNINLLSFIPFLTTFIMFWLAYNLGANKNLHFKALFLASAIGAGIFSIAKSLFVYYVVYSQNYTSLYGSFSIVMFAFIWIYVSWIIFLSGAYFCEFLDKYLENNK